MLEASETVVARCPRGCYVVSSSLGEFLDAYDLGSVGPFEDLEDLTADDALEAALRVAGGLLLGDLRATYAFVAESSRIRIKVFVCIARLSCRSPLRLSRCRLVSPEEAGIGATPAKDAKAASERNRPW
jgi:hypothetical protein